MKEKDENKLKAKSKLIKIDALESLLTNPKDSTFTLFEENEKARISKLLNMVITSMVNGSVEGKEKDARYAALHLVRLALQAVLLTHSKVSEISLSAKGVCDFVQDKSGFTELKKWIDKKGFKSDKIKKSSNWWEESSAITNLLSVEVVDNLPNFTAMKEKVAELKNWIQLVWFLTSNDSQTNRMTLRKQSRVDQWDRKLICMTLIMRLTLNRTEQFYSIKDCADMLDIINKDYDAWRNLVVSQAEQSMNDQILYLLNNKDFVHYLDDLKFAKNRNLMYMRYAVIWKRESRQHIEECCESYSQALKFLSKEIKPVKKIVKAQISKYVARMSFTDISKTLDTFPSLIQDMDYDVLEKCAVYDHELFESIAKKHKVELPVQWESLVSMMKKEFAVKDVIKLFWDNNPKPMGLPLLTFSKYRKIKKEKEVVSHAETIRLVGRLYEPYELLHFIEHSCCEPKDIPLDIALALHFLDKAAVKCTERLKLTEWFRFVDSNLKQKFDESFTKRKK